MIRVNRRTFLGTMGAAVMSARHDVPKARFDSLKASYTYLRGLRF